MSEKLKQGDEVTVIGSPYSNVKSGTVAVIEEIKPNHFGKDKHLFGK